FRTYWRDMNADGEQYALRATGIVKSFAGFIAIDDLTLNVQSGTIHAIIGPNGAGKTTLLGVFSGFVRPTAGRVTFADRDITHEAPAEIALMGIVRSFQINSIFPHMSAIENV